MSMRGRFPNMPPQMTRPHHQMHRPNIPPQMQQNQPPQMQHFHPPPPPPPPPSHMQQSSQMRPPMPQHMQMQQPPLPPHQRPLLPPQPPMPPQQLQPPPLPPMKRQPMPQMIKPQPFIPQQDKPQFQGNSPQQFQGNQQQQFQGNQQQQFQGNQPPQFQGNQPPQFQGNQQPQFQGNQQPQFQGSQQPMIHMQQNKQPHIQEQMSNGQQIDHIMQKNGLAQSDPLEKNCPEQDAAHEKRSRCREVDQEDSVLIYGPKKDDVSIFLAEQLPQISESQKDALSKAKKYGMEQSIRLVLMKQTLAHQQQQAKSLQRHQALVLMCRVYVGSISFELKEDTIRNSFGPFGPIKSINMSWDPLTQKHKGFAFVEYEMPEAAQLALEQMNGVMIGGRNIKVGRPSNMPQVLQAQTVIDEITNEAAFYNRIYVASVHQDLTENDIKSVFEAFGKIRACGLVPGLSANKHKGYGFIEYETNTSAHEAIASMNLFDLGGQYLRVGKAITPPGSFSGPQGSPTQMPTAAAVAAAAVSAKLQAKDALSHSPSRSPEHRSSRRRSRERSYRSSRTRSPSRSPQRLLPSVKSPPETFAPDSPSSSPTHIPEKPIVPPIGFVNITATVANGITPIPISGPVQEPTSVADHQEEMAKKLIEESEPLTLHQQETMSIKGQSARHLVMQKLMRNSAKSSVIVLRNMVGPEDVDEHLEGEISDECSRFGSIVHVIVYQERQNVLDDSEIIVKIFVEFSQPHEAVSAKENLHGRYFGGRMVVAEIYDYNMYIHNDLSG